MNKKELEMRIGKPIISELKFSGDGTAFSAHSSAVEYLEANGFSVGSMQSSSPIGVAHGDVVISKWYNLGKDIDQLDGALISDDFRNGPIVLYLTKNVV